MKHLPRNLLIATILSILIISCEDQKVSVGSRGELASSELMLSLTSDEIQAGMDFFGLSGDFQFDYAVEAWKIVYETIGPNGEATIASAGLFIPISEQPQPMVSLQHGTVTSRNNVTSAGVYNAPEGIIALLMAGTGLCTVVPDYLGLGESEILHTYLHAASTASAVIDAIRATRNFSSENDIALDGSIFLTGYSEGGYATLAAQREIEQYYSDEINLSAVAPMAGPYDLAGTVDTIFSYQNYSITLYPAFILAAYDNVYDWDRLDDMLVAPYDTHILTLLNGSMSADEVQQELPETLAGLIKSDFIDSYQSGNEPEMRAAIAANTLLDWHPATPIRFYHGDADETVPYQNSVTAAANLQALSTSTVELMTIAGGDHESAAITCFIGAIDWILSF